MFHAFYACRQELVADPGGRAV